MRYSAQDDPGLQDMLDAYCDSAGTVVMNLLKEDQTQSLTLKFAIEQGVYKDEVALSQYLSDAFINTPKTGDRILSLAVNEIEHMKKLYMQHEWLKSFPVIAEEYNLFYNPTDVNKSSLFSEFITGTGPENSLIIGGKMLEDIKSVESVQSLMVSRFRVIIE